MHIRSAIDCQNSVQINALQFQKRLRVKFSKQPKIHFGMGSSNLLPLVLHLGVYWNLRGQENYDRAWKSYKKVPNGLNENILYNGVMRKLSNIDDLQLVPDVCNQFPT